MKEILSSRKFLALIIGLAMLVLSGVYVNFPDVSEHLLEVVVPVAAYIFSVGLTPNTAGLGQVFTSQRFWVLIASMVAVLAKQFVPDFPVTEEQIIATITLFSTYIIGRGVAQVVNK